MKILYKTNKLKKSLTVDRQIIKEYGTLAKKIKQRMNELKAAENLAVIATLPALRLHQYKGDTKIWSIDIQQNWRILFELAQEPVPQLEDGGTALQEIKIIKIISVEDPH